MEVNGPDPPYTVRGSLMDIKISGRLIVGSAEFDGETDFSDASSSSRSQPTTFTHPAKSLYRRRLRSTMVSILTLATRLGSQQQAPTTSPPGGEGARIRYEGDIVCDIRIFADRHLSHKSRSQTLIACRHFSPWGRSRSAHARLLPVSEKMCEYRSSRKRAGPHAATVRAAFGPRMTTGFRASTGLPISANPHSAAVSPSSRLIEAGRNVPSMTPPPRTSAPTPSWE